VQYLPYLTLTATSLTIPEVNYYEKLWTAFASTPKMLGYSKSFDETLVHGCPSTPWADFITYRTKKFLDKYDIDGQYVDHGHVAPCENPLHGHGYRKGGKAKRTFPIFADRALRKRIYKLQKRKSEKNIVVGHTAGALFIPCAAFFDAYVEGERFWNILNRKGIEGDWMEAVTLAQFRAEFMGQTWGIISVALPEIRKKEYLEDRRKTETFLALCLIHGVNVYNNGPQIDVWAVDQVWQFQDKFGMEGVKFLGYWENGEIVKSSPEDIKVSIYYRKNRAFLAVANVSAKKLTGTIKVDVAKLGLSADGLKLTDALTGEHVSFEENKLIVPVAAKSFRLILIGQKN